MKKNMKYFLAVILSFIMVLGVGVISKNNDSFAAEYNGFEYSVSNGKATITGYNGYKSDIVIPSSIKGYPVTEIGNNAFGNFYGDNDNSLYIESVKMPNSIVEIGFAAFEGCENLRNVELSKNLKTIDNRTFFGCNMLCDIEIPNSVTSIGMYAFEETGLRSLKIPDSVTFINSFAFCYNYNLTSVKLSNSLEYIPCGLFYECTNLKSIEIPNSVKLIEGIAFYGCHNLESIKIPKSVTKIEGEILGECYSLKKIYVYQDSYAYRALKKEYPSKIVVIGDSTSVGNVTNLKYTSTTSTETLSWSKTSKASGYEVWMYKSSVGDYTKVKTITSGSTTSYKRSGLTSATMYRYKVRAYRTVNGVKHYGDFTNVLITGTKPLTPSITLSSTQKGKIKITWSNISKKTTGYQIYRATSRYGTYSRIATIEDGNISRSYTNTGRTSGKTYYYKVRAYRTLNNGKKVYSSYSTVKYIKAK